jgi:hypothetical protein
MLCLFLSLVSFFFEPRFLSQIPTRMVVCYCFFCLFKRFAKTCFVTLCWGFWFMLKVKKGVCFEFEQKLLFFLVLGFLPNSSAQKTFPNSMFFHILCFLFFSVVYIYNLQLHINKNKLNVDHFRKKASKNCEWPERNFWDTPKKKLRF